MSKIYLRGIFLSVKQSVVLHPVAVQHKDLHLTCGWEIVKLFLSFSSPSVQKEVTTAWFVFSLINII